MVVHATTPSDRLALRPLGEADAAFVHTLYASPEVTRALLRIQRPLSLAEARRLCEPRSAAPGEHRFVAVFKSNRQAVGLGVVRLHPPGQPASIGYSILPAAWRQGLGTELARLLTRFAFDTLGAAAARATTLDDNVASARVLEKLGFAVLETGAHETDSRGAERRVVRWLLRNR